MVKAALELRTSQQGMILRELQPQDVTEKYVTWMNDPEVVYFTEQKHTEHNVDSVTYFVNQQWQAEDCFLFGMFMADTHIGNIKLGPINWHHKNATLSYIIGDKDYWGKGLASCAIKTVVDFGFVELKLGKIWAASFDENIASIKALEKNGFVIEGRLHQHLIINGTRADQVFLGKVSTQL